MRLLMFASLMGDINVTTARILLAKRHLNLLISEITKRRGTCLQEEGEAPEVHEYLKAAYAAQYPEEPHATCAEAAFRTETGEVLYVLGGRGHVLWVGPTMTRGMIWFEGEGLDNHVFFRKEVDEKSMTRMLSWRVGYDTYVSILDSIAQEREKASRVVLECSEYLGLATEAACQRLPPPDEEVYTLPPRSFADALQELDEFRTTEQRETNE